MRESTNAHEPPSILTRPPADSLRDLPRDTTARERRLLVGIHAVLGAPPAPEVDRERFLRAYRLVRLAYEDGDPFLLDRPGYLSVAGVAAELESLIAGCPFFEEKVRELRA